MMSATTWPDPAVELVWAWQPDSAAEQLLVVRAVPSGGPRAPPDPFRVAGPSLPEAELCTVPAQVVAPAQSSVAEAVDQLDAPGTVGPPELALEPGATGVAGAWAGVSVVSPSTGSSVVVLTSAFDVLTAVMTGVMIDAFGSLEAPEFVTAWQSPPVTPEQVPSLREPRGSGDTLGSVADAALVTVPSQAILPAQVSIAPDTDAADGPATCRAVFTTVSADSCCAEPGDVDATEVVCAAQAPSPVVQVTEPVEDRCSVPSMPVAELDAVPVQPCGQSSCALELAVLDGPAAGSPVFGSTDA
jgi:hypothetical protein